MSRARRFARWGVSLAALIAAGGYVVARAGKPWDFETYYFAGAAFRAGLNPYSLENLTRVARRTVTLPFLYPPATLALFAPMSLLPKAVAAGAWLGFKGVLAAFLVWLWRREFLRGSDPSRLVVVLALGFDRSVAWDLRTGNVALLEIAILWIALAAFVRGRDALAGYLIALGSIFKLLPVGLLGVLAAAPRPRPVRAALIAGSAAFLAVAVSLPPGLAAEWRAAIVHASPNARLAIEVNPSALGLSDWLFGALGAPAASVPFLAMGAYLAFAAAILLLSLEPLRRARASSTRVETAMIAVLLWLLLSPRLMVYSFAMAIAPVLYAIETRVRTEAWRWLAALLVCAQAAIRLAPGPEPPMLGAASFAILLGAWALLRQPPSFPRAASSQGWFAHSPSPVPR
ncbi:MAG TPA: glycosyltransferase family 87 protein [Candidatus Binatia bacterium]|nr:glycosyltransferase family 87 protein [Candidatus Binatia bacterium]